MTAPDYFQWAEQRTRRKPGSAAAWELCDWPAIVVSERELETDEARQIRAEIARRAQEVKI